MKLESRLNPSNTPAQTTMEDRTAIKGKISFDGLTAIKDLVANNCMINEEPAIFNERFGRELIGVCPSNTPALALSANEGQENSNIPQRDTNNTPALAEMENVGHIPAIGAQGNTPVSTGCASERPMPWAHSNTLARKIDQASSNVH